MDNDPASQITQPITNVTTPQPAEVDKEVITSKPPRTKFYSTDPADGPDIAMGQSGITAEQPITIGEMMKLTVAKVPDRTALRYKTGDSWNDITFLQYFDMAVAAAKSFLKVQLREKPVYMCF